MHAASLTSQVQALEAELGRTEERGRAVVHARDDARREAAEAAHACAQLTQRAWAVAPRLLRLLPPPAGYPNSRFYGQLDGTRDY